MKKNTILVAAVAFVAAGLLACMVTSCATVSPTAAQPHPVWPAPPDPPRIIHRMTLRGPADIAAPSVLDKIGAAIAGSNSRVMVRPHALTVQGGKLLLITDQELQGVHALTLNSNKSRFIDRVGKLHFVSPVGVAACGENFAVSDSALKRVFILNPAGKLVKEVVNPGGFQRPTGLAFSAARNELYVVDTLANEVVVFDPSGQRLRRFGGPGSEPGKFHYPTHIFVDRRGFAFVTDSLNFRVQVFDTEGHYHSAIGSLGDASGHLAVPKGVGVDSFGHIYVVDSYFSNVQVFNPAGQLLLSLGGPGNGTGEFQVPSGLFVDENDRIYVCDSHNSRVQVFQYIGGADHENAQTQPH